MDTRDMDDGVRRYVEAIAPEHRPLFDRLHHLVLQTRPEANLVLSYRMPTYKVGKRRLHVGVWKHGLSLYGWQPGKVAAFVSRHPEARTSRGTVQLRTENAAAISDEDLCQLVRAALDD